MMSIKSFRACCATTVLAIAALAPVASHAATDLGTVSFGNPSVSFTGVTGSNDYTFTFDGSAASAAVAAIYFGGVTPITNIMVDSISLFPGAAVSTVTSIGGGVANVQSIEFLTGAFAPGLHTLAITSTTAFSGAILATSPAVPEAGAVPLALAGLAVVGALSARRRRSV